MPVSPLRRAAARRVPGGVPDRNIANAAAVHGCRAVRLGAAVALLLVFQGGGAEAREWPDTYVVSTAPGTLPEGITVEPDGTMYVSSDGTGQIYRGSVRTGHLRPFPAQGMEQRTSTLGVHTDRGGRIYSVGGSTLTVHDRAGRLLTRQTAQDGPLGPADLNDLVITRDAVYVTDWANPVVHRAEIRHGRVGPLRPWLDMRPSIPQFPARYWLLNGIVADPTGRTLLVASNGTEAVWRVDTGTREVVPLALDTDSFAADGMVLSGHTLYAVINYGAPFGVYIADLDADLRTGTVTHRITDAGFDLPTTLARHDCRLYVVNSQNDDPPGEPPYTVTAVADPTCG
ncbi:SMP-30/gluconolactonase/LRE family protein [Streptomyces sp. NPDC058001]|uniref:SMP-30/gluconolactonase/LRE family protein n=1 Tax=Streptomyces sp. NPDC058001 TaxID=3346300 RepID=UPI0036E96EA3